MLKPLYIALQLMTRLPAPDPGETSDRDFGYSVLYYPLIGLLIGALLYLLILLASYLGLQDKPLLVAGLLVVLWVALTGALHLDGLADSADAWLGGFGDRQRTLDIMKDPYAGPAAVVAVVLLLIVKLAALFYLLRSDTSLLIWIPFLARSGVIMLLLTTDYVRQHGIASQHMAQLPRVQAWAMLAASWLLCGWFVEATLIRLLLVTGVVFVLLRYLMKKRIGGMTGDTAGALIEILETALLVTLLLD